MAETNAPAWTYADGRWMPSDQAALRLDRLDGLQAPGLAENLAVKAGKPQDLAAHLRRLAEGCHAMGWSSPRPAELAALCRQAIRRNALMQGSLRLRWWAGRSEPVLLIQALPARPLPKGGLRLMTSAVRHFGPDSLNARTKSAAMLPNWLAMAETRAWAEDGLRLTPDGLVAEGVWSNIVAIKRRIARTAPLYQGVLEGVTRTRFLAKLRKQGLDVREEPLTRFDLWTAKAVWVTSSLAGAVPVGMVDGRPIGKSLAVSS